MLSLVEEHMWGLSSYVAGRSIEEVQRKIGNKKIIKLASNENPLGPSPLGIQAAARALAYSHIYPNYLRQKLKEKICQLHARSGIQPNQVVLGNGSNEIITLIARSFLGQNQAMLIGWPSFMVYHLAAKVLGRQEYKVPLLPDNRYDLPKMLEIVQQAHQKGKPVKLIFLSNPNNPTGMYINTKELARFLAQLPPYVIVVIDEAYAEYVDQPDYPYSIAFVQKRPRTVVLRTFSKIYGLASLRIGYGVCDPEIAEILHRVREPFNVNGVAQEAAFMALDDVEYIEKSKKLNKEELEKVRSALQERGVQVQESAGNFLMARFDGWGLKGSKVCEELLQKGVIIRPLDNYELHSAVRITIGTTEENQMFLNALDEVLSASRHL